jgi:hypothetical protein
MSRNTAAIGNALIAHLGSDATLLTFCPHGVYRNQAPPHARQFVVVWLIDATDEYVFHASGYEDHLYGVEVRMLESAGGDCQGAAAHLDTLLQDVPLTAAGYVWSTTFRERAVDLLEVDVLEPTIRWRRCGGDYRVQMAWIGLGRSGDRTLTGQQGRT